MTRISTAPLAAPKIGVGVIIWRESRVLLARRTQPPAKGAWSLPGGRQETGETVRETAHREVWEETRLRVRLTGLVDVVDLIERAESAVLNHFTLIDFNSEWESGEAVAGDDVDQICWASLEELDAYDLWTETRRVIHLAAEMRDGGRRPSFAGG